MSNNTLIEATQRLADILMQENAALKRVDYASATALVPVKDAALAGLTALLKDAARLPASLDPLRQRLGDLARENQMLLERAITVQTRIVRMIAQAGAPPQNKTQYGSYGKRAPSHRAAAMAISTRA